MYNLQALASNKPEIFQKDRSFFRSTGNMSVNFLSMFGHVGRNVIMDTFAVCICVCVCVCVCVYLHV